MKIANLDNIVTAYTLKINTITLNRRTDLPESHEGFCITSVNSAYEIFGLIFDDLDDDQEHFVMLMLYGDHSVIGYKTLCSGTASSNIIDVGLVAKNALLFGSTRVLVAHNHPNGCLQPSHADINITDRIRKAFYLLNIELLDHIILHKGEYLSMKEHCALW